MRTVGNRKRASLITVLGCGLLVLAGCSEEPKTALDLVNDLDQASIDCEPSSVRVEESRTAVVSDQEFSIPEVTIVECQTPGAGFSLSYWKSTGDSDVVEQWSCASLLALGSDLDVYRDFLKRGEVVQGPYWLIFIEGESLVAGRGIADVLGGQSLTIESLCGPLDEVALYDGEVSSIPDLDGLSLEEARDTLIAQDFTIGKVELEPSERAKGSVIAQRPSAGTELQLGTAIDLVVAGDTESILVPRLAGITDLATLQQTLDSTGLILGMINETPNSSPVGTVLEQSPEEDSVVSPGTAVDVVISSGEGGDE